ncbi:Dyp-type peroxidase [Paractinoplanes rishiriensis]|uniref:Peroxidase n=1 Tax=Paractinoplanes rishiriensis TaxID=1050105 RepID=A0A919MUH1_9ACTN|nr:Dyp-type peroxidase [Actinoplanes rishiriensis]GIE95334.1 peroxidase [Actinoplanes rishiriensis]
MAIDASSPLADPQQIQGNILRPFGGECQAFLFLSFASDRRAARRWLGRLAGRISGTGDVGESRVSPASSRIAPGRSLTGLGLTATGLVLLHGEVAGDLAGYDAFWRGPLGPRFDDAGLLTTAPALLGDVDESDPRKWVVGGPDGPPVDAIVTLAAGDPDTLHAAVDREIRAADDAQVEIHRIPGEYRDRAQIGRVLRNADGKRIEHFGFADGISQPAVRGYPDPELRSRRTPSAVIATGEFILGCAGERRPATWVPSPSPAPWMVGGSFQVFRRLRQNVPGWWDKMSDLAGAGGDPDEEAARVLGRHLDGKPLARLRKGGDHNAFDFGGDEDGERTPLFAHIRKMNPREDRVFRDRGHKMLRRGIPYGSECNRDHRDDADRGLLFNSFMASIENQFEFLQRRWANDPQFPASTVARYRPGTFERRVDGLDPVLGDSAEAARRRLGDDVVGQIPKSAFGGLVTTTGAVYAFAPSLRALRSLAGSDRLGAP